MGKGGGVSIPSEYTIKVGSAGSMLGIDADLDNIKTESTIEIKPLEVKPLSTNSTVEVKPLSTNSTVELKPLNLKLEPLQVTSDSTSAIDVKPLAIDSCQTVKLAPLPPICVEQPYSQHFGITFMEIELWGLNISGKSQTYLHSPPKQRHFGVETDATPENCQPPQESRPARRSGGLHVRVK